jgi:multidrug efflux pump subunit AcrB
LLATIVPRDPVAIVVAGLDAQRLSSIAPRLAEQVAATTGRVSPPLVHARLPATTLVPDRHRAADLGITVAEITDAARLWSSEGLELGLLAGDRRVVVVRIGDGHEPHWLERATVTGRDGTKLPLSSVARLEQSPAIDYARCERMRCVGVVVDSITAARIDLGALGSALALEQGETVLQLPLPPR